MNNSFNRKFSEADYLYYERRLFSSETQVEELEEICMMLAHLPIKRAQELLGKFRLNERAADVPWLDTAIEEGRYHYLAPQDEEEEREYLSLVLQHEMHDELIEMETELENLRRQIVKMKIRRDAINVLAARGDLAAETLQLENANDEMMTKRMADLQRRITEKQKIIHYLKSNMTIERYKNVDPADINDLLL